MDGGSISSGSTGGSIGGSLVLFFAAVSVVSTYIYTHTQMQQKQQEQHRNSNRIYIYTSTNSYIYVCVYSMHSRVVASSTDSCSKRVEIIFYGCPKNNLF